jgi:DNA modification methylase
VWDYAGVNTFKAGRLDELSGHPTAKPVALVADAIRDCSKRGQIVLDPFAGSGTTLIAAEKTGRRARLIEFDLAYCDRFAQVTGKEAHLAATGEGFEAVKESRGTSVSLSHGREEAR